MELRFCWGVELPVPERMIDACRFFDPPKLASKLILMFGAYAPSCTDLLITALDEKTDD